MSNPCASARIRRILAPLIAGVIALGLGACASGPPPARPAPQLAAAPAETGALARLEAQALAAAGVGGSAFTAIASNEEALRWRLALIDSAQRSLDLQYYVWFGDKVGQLMLSRVVAAADRGVRVRILFDDLNTMLHDMTHLELRDAVMRRIDRHPQIEIRVFNGWSSRNVLARAAELIWDFQRLDRRMHNKQMIADNRVAVLGGRNIGDEYFGLNPDFNFHDLDVLGVGPVARQASAVFDRYWNSDWVRRITLDSPDDVAGPSAADRDALARLESDARARLILTGQRDWSAELERLLSRLRPGTSVVHTDSPSRAANVRNHMPEAFRALMMSAQREVLITNAYVIPDDAFVADLRTLGARGVRVSVLTNSLASHDVPAVNSHYESWRKALLEAGVTLYEMRADAAIKPLLIDTAPVRGEFAGLHVKAMVIDRRRAFVGSMNLDPRSEVINSEMGIVIDSPPLAEELALGMDRDMGPANSWRVARADDGTLRWTSEAGTLERQPARNAWQRLENLLFKLLPPSLY
jgi:cardiolipin synthase C